MSDNYIYKKDELDADLLDNMAYLFHTVRMDRNLSLDEVSEAVNLPVLEIDGWECGMIDINFNHLIKLMDFYKMFLPFAPECFPGLPEKWRKRYMMTAADEKEVLILQLKDLIKKDTNPIWKRILNVMENI